MFPGAGYAGVAPADPDLAVGMNHIVQVVNSTISIYSKSGTLQFSQSASTFFTGVAETARQADPRVMYDRGADRFVLMYLELSLFPNQISNVLFAISDDGDPHGVWHRYRIDARVNRGPQDFWADFPGFAYNKDGYVVNTNLIEFSTSAWGGGQFLTIPKAAVLSGSPVTVSRFFDTASGNSTQVGENLDPGSDYVYGASRTAVDVTKFYALADIDTTSPSVFTTTIAVTLAGNPPVQVATTMGRFFLTGGSAIWTAVFRFGSLIFAYNRGDGSLLGWSHWTEVAMGDWPNSGTVTEVHAGQIRAPSNKIKPAVGINKHGDISIIYTHSDASLPTANFEVRGRVASDGPGVTTTSTLLKRSTGNYYRFTNRWGDYFGVDVDPVDDELFWGTAMLVRPDGWWDTEIASWNVSTTYLSSPSTSNWIRGSVVSGNNDSLAATDGDYFTASAGLTLFAGEPPAQLVADLPNPPNSPVEISVSMVSHVNTSGLSQRIQLFNFNTGLWVDFGTQLSTTSDSIQTVTASGTLQHYTNGGVVKARVQWFQTGLTLLWPWAVSVDSVELNFRAR
ncbi:MAG: hypothetical protein IH945_01735 [Armatimonadetes bacterium]|nr:hypothetical protein [Armatimonadota bacterium]